MGLIIFGIVLIVLQLISLEGTMVSGGLTYFSNVTNIQVFIYDLLGFIGYFLVGIIGVVLILSGALSLRKEKRTEKRETEKHETEKATQEQAEEMTVRPAPIEKSDYNVKSTSRGIAIKALIWIGCCILHYIISNIIKPIVYQIPVTDDRSILLVSTLYGLLIAVSGGFSIWLAKSLCKKWDLYKAAKAETKTHEYNDYQALLNENIEKAAPEVTQNKPERIEIVTHNIKPTKAVNSKKPLTIVTYILLIAIIIALSVFCILSVKDIKEKENTISQLETDITILEGDLKITKNNLNRKDTDLKIANAKISDNNRLLQNKEAELKAAKADIEYWKTKYMATDLANVTYSYEFSSVNALLTAIKKNPEAYQNKQVKVFGMILTYKISKKTIGLIDYKGENLSSYSEIRAGVFMDKKIEAKSGIEVTLSSDLQYTVAETGDYVNLYGIVKIINGEIYLDKCQYYD